MVAPRLLYRAGRIAVDGAAGTAVQPAARRVQLGFHGRGILGRGSPVALPLGQCLRPEKRLRLPAGRADAAALRSDDRLPHARRCAVKAHLLPDRCRFSPSDCAMASRCRLTNVEDIPRDAGTPRSRATRIAAVGNVRSIRSDSTGAMAETALPLPREALRSFKPAWRQKPCHSMMVNWPRSRSTCKPLAMGSSGWARPPRRKGRGSAP